MKVRIRTADLTSDRTQIAGIIQRHLSPGSDHRRFDWLYLGGPFGAARAWVAFDDATAKIVGVAGIFPRKMYIDDKEKLGCVLGDFCLEEAYRSLGPALELQRACLAQASSPPFQFYYDFPSSRMMAVYKRLGVNQTETVVRWVLPLGSEPKLRQVFRSEGVARAAAAIVDPILASRSRKHSTSACEISLHLGECGEEFTSLDRELRDVCGVSTARTAEYLNWRYLKHPEHRFEILTARHSNHLFGYAVFGQDAEAAWIADVCCVPEPAIRAGLLSAVAEILQERGVTAVNLVASSSHPWSGTFHRCGFSRREESPLIVRMAPNGSGRQVSPALNWHFMQGERES